MSILIVLAVGANIYGLRLLFSLVAHTLPVYAGLTTTLR